MQARYKEVLSQYKEEINKLNEELHQLSLERDTRVVTSPTKIEDSALVRRLEEENGQLKKVVDILNAEINNLKRKSQAIQNSEAKEDDQNANSLLKSISFSNENRNKFESNRKKEAYSKIRIEDIYEDEVSDDTDTI